jgi:HlyD family secretion protein
MKSLNLKFYSLGVFAVIFLTGALLLPGCSSGNNRIDASGMFEAVETIVSTEATGTIKEFNVEEGQVLSAGQNIGYVDSVQLYLKKQQLVAQIASTLSQKPDVAAQIASLQVQLDEAKKDQQRMSDLQKSGSATQQQLDDANAKVDMIKKEIEAQESTLGIATTGINRQTVPLEVQIEQIDDQLLKCRIINPINGTVLTKYVEQDEEATPGKALYKIADLSSIILRAYITADQYNKIKLGQTATVLTDSGDGSYTSHTGTITWINDKAEFTPKTIQTKDERANLVYAIKITVPNDGTLKIGMYADVRF